MKSVIILGGPTASGKTATALLLAEGLRARGLEAECIVADSIAHYRGFDIGAAKPSREEQAQVRHHLIDICEPEEEFSAGDFIRASEPILEKLKGEGKIGIVVGGSGFYLKALVQGMAIEEDPEEKEKIRATVAAREEKLGLEALYQEMLGLDPVLEGKIHPNDRYRILRALEAMELSGRTWSELNAEAKQREPRIPHYFFTLNLSLDEARLRIQDRAQQMLEQGLLAEVEGLLAKGVSPQCKPMQSVGYHQCLEYLGLAEPPRGWERPTNRKELEAAITLATGKLAKAQLTWFGGQAPQRIDIPVSDPREMSASILAKLDSASSS